jgi:hypothetical protein
MLKRPILVSCTESKQMRTHKISLLAASSFLRTGNDLILALLHFRDSQISPRSHLSHLSHLSQLSQVSRFSQATNHKTKSKAEAKAKVRANVTTQEYLQILYGQTPIRALLLRRSSTENH